MKNTEKIIWEIEEFHKNIEKWFQGKAENQKSLYKKLLAGFSTDFKMINGNGETVTLSMLEETQVTGEITTKRKSSAVFLLNKEKALWLHLIENWI